jgi:hypothetical protein
VGFGVGASVAVVTTGDGDDCGGFCKMQTKCFIVRLIFVQNESVESSNKSYHTVIIVVGEVVVNGVGVLNKQRL